MKKFFVITLVFTFLAASFAQKKSVLENKAIARGRITTASSKVIEAQHLVVSKDSVEYYVKESSDRYFMGLGDVSKIEEFKGDHSTAGIWVGSLVGGGIGLAVALGSKETKRVGIFEETTIQTWPIYVFTLAGGLIGYAIGASAESWDTAYSSGGATAFNLELRNLTGADGFCMTFRMNL